MFINSLIFRQPQLVISQIMKVSFYTFLFPLALTTCANAQTLQQVTQNGSVTTTGITASSFTSNSQSIAGEGGLTNIGALNGLRLNGSIAGPCQNGITFQSGGGGGAAISFYRVDSYGTGIDFYANTNSAAASGNLLPRMRISQLGKIGIGTMNPTSLLTVAGNIESQEIKVSVTAGADYVLQKNYKLPALGELEAFINVNNHLPEIMPAEQMKKEGIELGEMNIKLLKKIEELTLYIIDQDKRIRDLESKR